MSAQVHAEPGNVRLWWQFITALLVAAIFSQAVFAGLMLSGVAWAQQAHAVNAVVLLAASFGSGLVALLTVRRVSNGANLAFSLLALAVVISLQTAVGKSSAGGANLMWLHVPLGVALIGFAMQAVAVARKLGELD